MLDRRLFLASAAGFAATACSRTAEPTEAAAAAGVGRTETAAEAFEAIRATLGPGARLGVAAIETGSGRRLVHDADSRYAMASTFKLPLAAFALAEADAGRLSLEEKLPFAPEDPLPHSPAVKRYFEEGGLSVVRLCSAIVELSDNSAANMLLRRLGGPQAFTRFVRACGDPVTRLDRWELELNSNLPGDPRDTTSPAAMADLVRALVAGDILLPQSRSHLSTWLKKAVPGPDRLPAGMPERWLPGHKTGTGANGATNDVAVAWRSGAAPIVIASYQSGGDAEPAARAAAHAAVARLVAQRLG